MNKISSILLLAIGMVFVSCKKEENAMETIVEQQALFGTWNVTGHEIEDGISTTETSGQKLVQGYSSYGKDYDITVDFNESPNTVVSNGSYTTVITYTLQNQEYTQEAPAYSALESSAWEVTGSEVLFTTEDNITPATIIEASNTRLILKMDYNRVVEAGSSTKVTTTGLLTLTLER